MTHFILHVGICAESKIALIVTSENWFCHILQDGTVTLKLSINYGVDHGSIVAVGPASCFGQGDINRGTPAFCILHNAELLEIT